jgi:hypothetical protein
MCEPLVQSLLFQAGKSAAAHLGRAHASRPVVQDYCPFPQSVEWQLGQRYLSEHGSRAFLHDPGPVPYVVNNDGALSRRAAQVLFEGLLEAEAEGNREEEIQVLEVGIGVGLFARLFLDAFRALCREEGKDYYDRLCYVAGDYAGRMLLDACRHGAFANHPGRYSLRLVGPSAPKTAWARALAQGRCPAPSGRSSSNTCATAFGRRRLGLYRRQAGHSAFLASGRTCLNQTCRTFGLLVLLAAEDCLAAQDAAEVCVQAALLNGRTIPRFERPTPLLGAGPRLGAPRGHTMQLPGAAPEGQDLNQIGPEGTGCRPCLPRIDDPVWALLRV